MTANTPAPTRGNAVALIAICLSALMFGLEISSVPLTLPIIGRVLHGRFAQLQWIMNAYTLASVTVLVASGVLADRYGRRRVLIIAVTGFGLASLLCGLAPDVPALIAGRFLQGVTGGAMIISGLAILSHQFPAGPQRARAFGIWGVGFGAGLGFGPAVGGALITLASWRWVFLVHAPIAVASVLLAHRGVPESRDTEAKRLDVAGIATLSLAAFALVFYIVQGPTLGFHSVSELGILAGFAASAAAFVVIETHVQAPMFPFSLFRIRPFSGALLGAAGMNFSFWPLMIYLPVYLEHGLGYGAGTAARVLLAFTLPTFVLPPLSERLALKHGAPRMISTGLGVIGTGFLLLYLGSQAGHASWLTLLPGALLASVGLGLTNTPVTNTTTGSVPSARAGTASGIDLSARLISLAVNIALIGLLLTIGIRQSLRQHLPTLSDGTVSALGSHVADGDPPTSLLTTTHRIPDLSTAERLDASAITHGFGFATLYGCLAAWLLAVATVLVFGRRPRRRRDEPARPVHDLAEPLYCAD